MKPSSDDLRLAAEWLEIYEGVEDAEACQRVASWLVEQADARDLRDAAREHGVPVSALRKKIAEAERAASDDLDRADAGLKDAVAKLRALSEHNS